MTPKLRGRSQSCRGMAEVLTKLVGISVELAAVTCF
jgi:hypothetical protein